MTTLIDNMTNYSVQNVQELFGNEKHRSNLASNTGWSVLCTGALGLFTGAPMAVGLFAGVAAVVHGVARAVFAGALGETLKDDGYKMDLGKFTLVHVGALATLAATLNVGVLFFGALSWMSYANEQKGNEPIRFGASSTILFI